jgi:hypothetical protein
MNNSKYLSFIELASVTKTKVFEVRNRHFNNELLGHVKWYAPWRKYCFVTYFPIVCDSGCLANIQDFINNLMAERKKPKHE